MSVFDSSPLTPLVIPADRPLLDEGQLAAVAFLARYGGRTLESYRADSHQAGKSVAVDRHTGGAPPTAFVCSRHAPERVVSRASVWESSKAARDNRGDARRRGPQRWVRGTSTCT